MSASIVGIIIFILFLVGLAESLSGFFAFILIKRKMREMNLRLNVKNDIEMQIDINMINNVIWFNRKESYAKWLEKEYEVFNKRIE